MEELLKSRRSIRKYKEKKISKEDINNILKCGLLSPSAKNGKPWEIYVTEDEATIKKLSESKESGIGFIKEAPLLVALAADPAKSTVWIEDLSIMATIMQLKAHTLGIGSCWVQIRDRHYREGMLSEDYIKEVLTIEKTRKVLCLISFGYAGEEKKAYTDDDVLSDRIFWR